MLSVRLGVSSTRTFSGSCGLDGLMGPAGSQDQAVRLPEAAGMILAGWSARLAARGELRERSS